MGDTLFELGLDDILDVMVVIDHVNIGDVSGMRYLLHVEFGFG